MMFVENHLSNKLNIQKNNLQTTFNKYCLKNKMRKTPQLHITNGTYHFAKYCNKVIT